MGGPAVVERCYGAAPFTLGGGESYVGATHGHAGGYGYAALLVVVDGTVEVVDHAVVLDNVALVGEHLVVGFGGYDEVGACPVLPVYEVARDGEGVVGVILAVGVIGREVEHDVQGGLGSRTVCHVAGHAHYLGVAGDDAGGFVGVDGVGVVALPLFQVVAEGNANAFGLEVVLGVDASGIIEHEEAVVAQLGRQQACVFFVVELVDGALVLCQLLPPLGILVVDAEQGFPLCVPLVGLCGVALGPRHADVQGLAYGLVACAVAADVGHPVLAFILAQTVAAVPRPVDECREAASLVGIPAGAVGGIAQQASLCLPVQQVVGRCQPRLVAAPVEAFLAVVDDVGHQPLAAHAEDGGAVYLVVVVLGGYHHAVLIGSAHLLIDALHLLLADRLCRDGEADEYK